MEWAPLGKGLHCHDLLANLQKKIISMCLAEGLGGFKNPLHKEGAAESQNSVQVLFE